MKARYTTLMAGFAAVAMLALSAPAFATEDTGVHAARTGLAVTVSDLSADSADDVEVLRGRFHRAAVLACRREDPNGDFSAREWRACVSQATERAYAQLNSPMRDHMHAQAVEAPRG